MCLWQLITWGLPYVLQPYQGLKNLANFIQLCLKNYETLHVILALGKEPLKARVKEVVLLIPILNMMSPYNNFKIFNQFG